MKKAIIIVVTCSFGKQLKPNVIICKCYRIDYAHF